ncbi:MAG: hypothetical protein ACRC1K_06100 [Planctomycetia bacterium]
MIDAATDEWFRGVPAAAAAAVLHGGVDGERHWVVAGRLAASAVWRGDRWILAAARWSDGAWRPRCRCHDAALDAALDAERGPADECGGDPVFQQCVGRVADESRAELLLVGQSGRRHFSAVFAVDAAGGCNFEVADRSSVRSAVERFTLHFVLNDDDAAGKNDWRLLEVDGIVAGPPGSYGTAVELRVESETPGDSLLKLASAAGARPASGTVRYGVRWTSPID